MRSQKVERPQMGWSLWLRWVLATVAGFTLTRVVGVPVGLIAGSIIAAWAVGGVPEDKMENIVSWVVFGVVAYGLAGAATGMMQWLILRRHLKGASWWVLSSALSFAMGAALGFLASGLLEVLGTPTGAFLIIVASGPVVGTAQWVVLRRQVYRAGWWILATSLAWGLGWSIELLTGSLAFVASGIVVAAITGAVLVWLLRRPAPSVESIATTP